MADIQTYGDLKKIIKAITTKQKVSAIVGGGKSKASDIVLDATVEALKATIPGIGLAKQAFDIFKGAIKKPDTKKTNTWLDKLDVDDNMSKIVDDTVENGFIEAMTKSIESEPDDKPLESDFNMNARMVGFLQSKYQGRTIAGIKESKMDIKELIKQLVRDVLDEESTSGDAGPYSTPFAFAKKGQKTNVATKTAVSQGYTKAPAGMPSDSKVKDYKAIWKSAEKPKYKMYKENMNIQDIIEQELLNEATYKQFKKEVKFRTKAEQLHKAMREVKRKLTEIDRIVDYTQRMKQELSEGDGTQYWGRTEKAVHSIAEMMNHLNTKINNLKQ
jgi:hypothetical protein